MIIRDDARHDLREDLRETPGRKERETMGRRTKENKPREDLREQIETTTPGKIIETAPGSPEDIIIETPRGIVTRSDIETARAEYIDMLPDPDKLYTNVQTFTGMMMYICKKLNKYAKKENSNRNDYRILDIVFTEVFFPICMYYGYTANILMFCTCMNISYGNIYNLCKGINTVNGNIVNKEIYRYIQKWRGMSESTISTRAVENNSIGAIFHLKARHAWQDAHVIQIDAEQPRAARLTIDQIDAISEDADAPGIPEEDADAPEDDAPEDDIF